MNILITALMIFFIVPDVFARSSCPVTIQPGHSDTISKLFNSADSMACLNTKAQYQCAKVEAELETSEKYKVIQCDGKSLEANRLGNVSIADCIWNGLKISGDSLVDLTKLPGAIAGSIAKGFSDTQVCNSSLDKKREILKAFNLSVEDTRFQLSEQFLGNWLSDASCAEIKKTSFEPLSKLSKYNNERQNYCDQHR